MAPGGITDSESLIAGLNEAVTTLVSETFNELLGACGDSRTAREVLSAAVMESGKPEISNPVTDAEFVQAFSTGAVFQLLLAIQYSAGGPI